MPAGEKPLQTVNMITFGGGYSLPAWVAQGQGFFAKHGIEVNITHTPNSVFLMKNLIEGKFDLTVTAMDNLVAYQEGQGEAEYTGSCDLVAFMGVDDSFQSLMASPDIKSVADLRGKKIAVDALTTGYAFILREMIARAGMTDADVTYERTGGGPMRLKAMLDGNYAAGLLATPLDKIAADQGFTRLGTARELLGRYQGRTGFAQRAWIKNNQAAVIGFMRGYRDAMDWLYDRNNRAAAADLLMANDASVTAELARLSLDILLDDKGGFWRDLALDLDGIRTVLALRTRFGVPQKTLTDPLPYVDLTLHDKAFKNGD
ncbi:MAG: ABC transporter substrate-binding protein [Burkholderiales bacterium]|jgi:ABC-type nitrate/sulfonate/bicarbonate transport system substrate-binding protein|nr:ABC transporter substrate-binding protein [Burkholderiales bacterium]